MKDVGGRDNLLTSGNSAATIVLNNNKELLGED